MSAPSTPCTPPPGHWPNAATRCSRPPSRRCAGSASAPGGSARSPPPPSSCSTTSTAAPHDQQAREAVTGNGSVAAASTNADLSLQLARKRPGPDLRRSSREGLTAFGDGLLVDRVALGEIGVEQEDRLRQSAALALREACGLGLALGPRRVAHGRVERDGDQREVAPTSGLRHPAAWPQRGRRRGGPGAASTSARTGAGRVPR